MEWKAQAEDEGFDQATGRAQVREREGWFDDENRNYVQLFQPSCFESQRQGQEQHPSVGLLPAISSSLFLSRSILSDIPFPFLTVLFVLVSLLVHS